MTDDSFEGLTEGIKRYVLEQVGKVFLLCEKVDERVHAVETKAESADRRSHYMEGRVDELKEQLVLVETQMKTYHGEVMTEIKQVVKTFEPLGFLSEHAPDFQSMIVGYKKCRSTWGFVGKTALGALVVALVSGIIALLVAGLIQKLQPPERTVITQHTETYERRPDDTHHSDSDTRQQP